MLTQKEIQRIRKELDSCKNPLYFFHDDPDGLASFLLLYRHIKEGQGIPVKATPNIDEKFLRKVEEYKPDKIFILDIALVQDEFIEKAKTPIIWIDHHLPQNKDNVLYFNPRKKDIKDETPVSLICYEVVQKDLWIAATGCVGDWHWDNVCKKFSEKYPHLLPKEIKNPEDALFKTELGKLTKIFSFVLMGKTSEVKRYVNVLTRIKGPEEILHQKSSAGNFVYKKYLQIKKVYDCLLLQAENEIKEKDKIVMFIYTNTKYSFTKDLANEFLYRYPNRIIIMGRDRNGEIKISLRARKLNIRKAVEKALNDVEGYGGGHDHACGAVIKKQDFDRFLANLKKEIK